MAPLGLGPVPPAHALGTERERHWHWRVWGVGKDKKEHQTRMEVGMGASPTMGRNSLMLPVRFPPMICQWNMSWGRERQLEL